MLGYLLWYYVLRTIHYTSYLLSYTNKHSPFCRHSPHGRHRAESLCEVLVLVLKFAPMMRCETGEVKVHSPHGRHTAESLCEVLVLVLRGWCSARGEVKLLRYYIPTFAETATKTILRIVSGLFRRECDVEIMRSYINPTSRHHTSWTGYY